MPMLMQLVRVLSKDITDSDMSFSSLLKDPERRRLWLAISIARTLILRLRVTLVFVK